MFKRIINNRLLIFGISLLFIVFFAAIFAPFLTTYDPIEISIENSLLAVSWEHPFGTDEMGRDVLTRVLFGARISLWVGAVATFYSGVFGVLFGLLSGYYQTFDSIFSRLVDGLMVFPGLIMAILLMAALGPSTNNVIIAMVILYTPRIVRVVRSSVIVIKNEDYIDSARVLGANDLRILFIHILPNAFAPLIVQVAFGFAWAILVESGMSFLGLGMPAPTPSWGNIISDGRNFIYNAPWIMMFPGLALSLAVMGLNFIGDGLRDYLDPHLRNTVRRQ
ncbi:MAG TPA: ABC transporter permease [Gammaproteobacteria bacterium]|jgi:peptide/nickel transport system permease protein|nr:ABC transporter permease [Gammaproteobacteria bacterium]